MRRLTRQPLTFCWIPTGDDSPGRVLVRVVSPPTLAIERVADSGVAYAEHAPGVWVQLGYRPPQPDQLLPLADRLLLVRPGEQEIILPGEFVAEIESLSLVATVVEPNGSPPPNLAIRLRLARANDHELPWLWVLRDDALGQLTAYCRVTHQQLLARFSVAVSATAGVPCVVLRAVTVKGPPPVFIGPATAYAPRLNLPNVFLPTGTRLTPVLRRDALRQALAVHPDRVHWLYPLECGGFQVESLPEAAFRPLVEWIDFRVPEAVPAGRTWGLSRRWEFETFVEVAPNVRLPTLPAREVAKPSVGPEREGFRSRAVGWLKGFRRAGRRSRDLSTHVDPSVPVEEAVRTALNQGDRLHHARPEANSLALERCQAMEAQFLQALPSQVAESPADQWAELAAAYDAAGNHADAALCWLSALWTQTRPSPLWAWGWLRSEAKAARPEVKVIDPGPWLATAPGPGTTRAMAAWIVWANLQTPTPPALSSRGPEMQARLEAHEHWLPVRAAWLARSALARAGRGDVLSLARTRDRLAERLLASGLSLELDTPSFLRFAGDGVRERFQEARRWLADRRDLIHQWLAHRPEDTWARADPADGPGPLRQVGLEPDVANTRGYADLILAWGLSRFAEHATADNLRRQGVAALPADNSVHVALRDGFLFRIAQVREGKPPRGPLPAELLARIDRLTGVPRYAVDKLRQHSRILEPTTHVEGYGETVFRKAHPGSPADQVAALPRDRLDDELGRLLEAEAARPGRPHLEAVTVAALERASELSETAVEMVFAVLPAAFGPTRKGPTTHAAHTAHAALAAHARLIEVGMEAASRWDRADVTRDLAGRFLRLTDEVSGWSVIESLIGPTVQALRRVGLPAQADRVLDHVAHRVHLGQPLGRVRADRPGDWPAGLRVLLKAAAGWYAGGRDEPAHAVLDEARRDLFANETTTRQRTDLAFAYATTLGHAPVRVALGRLEEMFQRLRGIDVIGTFNAYYSLRPLMLVETAVRAVVSDEFALGPQVRSWLNADELAVRRRIRDDLKAVLAAQGL